ncbi:hypothetical protein OU426_07840 [Frigidibacter sp. RF13]|uniref:hypothetical protein n=1 Tax=Frigidibacter sp. RF13 TaxID=2997340 RepID=UPI00226D8EE1|nr:hypothetical protein [Frigidibacter sp. RF13]MCY1126759.1 hypothetical protein [Frigidibacter sp. RF13]
MTSTPFDKAKIAELVPFWVNGSLTDAEAEALAREFERDPALHAQVQAARQLRELMRASALPERSPGDFGLARLRRSVAEKARAPAALRQSAAAAAIAAAVTAGGFTLVGWGSSDEGYRQAAGPQPAAIFTVSVRDAAPHAAFADLLLANGLTIIDGPSALGFYRLALVGAAADSDIDAARSALEHASELLELVETAE